MKKKIVCTKHQMNRIYRIPTFQKHRNNTEALVLALDTDRLNLFN